MAEEKVDHQVVQSQQQSSDDEEYPPTKKLLPIMGAIWLSFFVVALDRTIIGTAVPTISREFNSFGDIAWYEAGFLLPLCALQLSFGRIYTYYPTKWVIVINVAIFEIGSIVCAAAPSSHALIIGRVIQGIGGAGIPPGAFLLIVLLVKPQDRPKYTGALGSVFGVTSILGPVLGGYLTSVTWRWCFWINLPVGGVSMVLLILLTPNSAPPVKRSDTWKGKFLELDPLGFVLVAPTLICLLLAIQFGGTRYAWNSGTVIALLVLFALFGIAFVASQIWRGEKGTVPPHIILQRSILSGSVASIGIGSVLVITAFYLPIWFQVIQGKSPQNSGLSLIPLLLSVVVAVMAGGIFASIVGYYTPGMIVGAAILIVGAGLISTWSVDIKPAVWIGYQIVTGLGLGLVLQAPNLAAQTILPRSEASIGLAIINLFSFLGASVFVTVGQNLLATKLVKGLRPILPNVDATMLSNAGATAIRSLVPADQLPVVLDIYNDAIKSIWYLTLGLACLVFVASWGMEWKNLKAEKKKVDEEKQDGAQGETKEGLDLNAEDDAERHGGVDSVTFPGRPTEAQVDAHREH